MIQTPCRSKLSVIITQKEPPLTHTLVIVCRGGTISVHENGEGMARIKWEDTIRLPKTMNFIFTPITLTPGVESHSPQTKHEAIQSLSHLI